MDAGAPMATYVDPLGWTIDVPENWHTIIHSSDRVGASFVDGDPSGEGFTALPPDDGLLIKVWHDTRDQSIADDSAFPLSASDLRHDVVWTMSFRGDGLRFHLMVIRPAGWLDLPPDVLQTIERIIASIRFQPWEDRERRNGWTSLRDEFGPVTDQPIRWFEMDGGTWAYVATDPDGDRTFYGYVDPPCRDARFVVTPDEIAAVECGGELYEGWTASGEPADGFPARDFALEDFPAIKAWDGTLLVRF